MKNLFARLAVLALLIPALANADVKSDMNNASLSLVAVMQNATNSGLSVSETVKAMIEADASQASAIVATGMIVAPDQYEAIVSAAIEAGVPASTVVGAALVASDGENADMIVAAAVKAAPDQQDAIVAASVQVLPQTSQGLTAVSASPMRASVATSSGGGAGVTASEVISIQTTLAAIESQLAAAGFTGAELADAVGDITTALQTSQANAATAINRLQNVQVQLKEIQVAQAELPALIAAQQAAQEAALAAEEQLNAVVESASAASAEAERIQTELVLAEQEDAALDAEVAEINALLAKAGSDPTAAQEELIAKYNARREAADATGLASKEDADSALVTAKTALGDIVKSEKKTQLELDTVNTLIASAEAAAFSQEQLTAALSDSSIAQLRAQRDQIIGNLNAILEAKGRAALNVSEAAANSITWSALSRLDQGLGGIPPGDPQLNLLAALGSLNSVISSASTVTKANIETVKTTVTNAVAQANAALANLAQSRSEFVVKATDAVTKTEDVAATEKKADATTALNAIEDVTASLSTT